MVPGRVGGVTRRALQAGTRGVDGSRVTPALRRRAVLVGSAMVLGIAGATAAGHLLSVPPVVEPRPVVTLVRDVAIDLPHEVDGPRTDDGCPAATFRSPHPAMETTVGSASVAVPLPRLEAHVMIVCLGRAAEIGDTEELVRLRTSAPDDAQPLSSAPVTVRSAFGEAVRLDTTFSSTGTVLLEWFTDHDGWLMAVGYLGPPPDPEGVATVEAMLTTWSWS